MVSTTRLFPHPGPGSLPIEIILCARKRAGVGPTSVECNNPPDYMAGPRMAGPGSGARVDVRSQHVFLREPGQYRYTAPAAAALLLP